MKGVWLYRIWGVDLGVERAVLPRVVRIVTLARSNTSCKPRTLQFSEGARPSPSLQPESQVTYEGTVYLRDRDGSRLMGEKTSRRPSYIQGLVDQVTTCWLRLCRAAMVPMFCLCHILLWSDPEKGTPPKTQSPHHYPRLILSTANPECS